MERVAQGETDGLPLGAEKPSHKKKQGTGQTLSKNDDTVIRSGKEAGKAARNAESSGDSEDTADETQTPTATQTETAEGKMEARAATKRDLQEKTDAGKRTPEVSASDETPPLRSTRARKAVTKLGRVMIRQIQKK